MDQIEKLVSKQTLDKVKTLYDAIEKDSEFEFMFFNYTKNNPMSLEYYFKSLKAEEVNKDSNNIAIFYANISNIYFYLHTNSYNYF